jgi:hypothetical protein
VSSAINRKLHFLATRPILKSICPLDDRFYTTSLSSALRFNLINVAGPPNRFFSIRAKGKVEIRTLETGNDIGSKLNALIRRVCKCAPRASVSDNSLISAVFPLAIGSVDVVESSGTTGSISSLAEANRTAGEPSVLAVGLCSSWRARSQTVVSTQRLRIIFLTYEDDVKLLLT